MARVPALLSTSQLGEAAEAGIAGAEIVQRQADPERAQLVHGGDDDGALIQEHALGDLEHQMVRGQLMLGEDLRDHGGQVDVLEIDRRQVDRDAGNVEPGSPPDRHLPAGLADRPHADLLDQPAFLGKRDEFCRRDLAQHRVMPARQRLDAMDRAVAGADLRLVVQAQGLAGDGAAQRRGMHQPLLGELVHVGVEEAIGAAAGALGLVHRGIGLLDQRVDVGGIVGVEA